VKIGAAALAHKVWVFGAWRKRHPACVWSIWPNCIGFALCNDWSMLR